jgi:hypothetical protein
VTFEHHLIVVCSRLLQLTNGDVSSVTGPIDAHTSISDINLSFNMRKWIHERSIVGTVVSNQETSLHLNNMNSAGRTGLRRTSGGVTLTAVVDQVRDGDAKRPPSPTTTDEVICCTSYRPTWADGCAIDSPSFSICSLSDRRNSRKPKTRACLGG